MNPDEERVKQFMKDHWIVGEFLTFEKSCHTVEEAAIAASTTVDEILKNICLVDSSGRIIIATVMGKYHVSTERVGKALGVERPRIATPQEIREKIGFPAGGVPSFGFSAIFLIDPTVMERETVYTSGGSENTLIKMSPIELQKANDGKVVRFRK